MATQQRTLYDWETNNRKDHRPRADSMYGGCEIPLVFTRWQARFDGNGGVKQVPSARCREYINMCVSYYKRTGEIERLSNFVARWEAIIEWEWME